MTDNEIIKALDVCGHLDACADCPLGCLEGVDKCMHTLLLNALDLINRQKEDIDELEAIVDLRSKRKYYQKFVTEVYQKEKGNELSTPDFDYIYELYFKQKAEIEDKSEKLRKVLPIVAELKAEAIKEFAEGLTKKIFPIGYLCDGNYSVNAKAVKTVIDNLVKEMTEEKK